MPRVLPRVELTPEQLADLRHRVERFMRLFPAPKLVVTRGLDDRPRYRLMGVRVDGFRCYLISIKPSEKLAELRRDPRIDIVWYEDDAADANQDQPLRLVAVEGRAEIVETVAGMRAFPSNDPAKAPLEQAWRRVTPPTMDEMDDQTLDEKRFGVIVHPERIRVEGFVPGPRYPIFLTP